MFEDEKYFIILSVGVMMYLFILAMKDIQCY